MRNARLNRRRFVVQLTGNFVPLFIIAGSAYLLALLVIHSLDPDVKPALLD